MSGREQQTCHPTVCRVGPWSWQSSWMIHPSASSAEACGQAGRYAPCSCIPHRARCRLAFLCLGSSSLQGAPGLCQSIGCVLAAAHQSRGATFNLQMSPPTMLIAIVTSCRAEGALGDVAGRSLRCGPQCGHRPSCQLLRRTGRHGWNGDGRAVSLILSVTDLESRPLIAQNICQSSCQSSRGCYRHRQLVGSARGPSQVRARALVC